jgi:L-phenylalanine/L-methionine N-acetyltransferase
MSSPAAAASRPNIVLRRPRPSDAPAVAAYMGHAEVFGNLLQLPHPSAEMWVERLQAPPEGSFSLVAEVENTAGNLQLAGLAGVFPDKGGLRRRHVLHLGISVAVPFHGQGVGSALMSGLLDYADNWANCLRVELEVFADNAAAIAMYERHGFVLEGRKRCDSLRHGVYTDSVTMGRLHPKQPLLRAA